MRRRGPAVACVLLLLTNAYVLLGVAYNRSGEAGSEMELTERELGMPYRASDEDTTLSLRLEWGQWSPSIDESDRWFDRAKLEAIGFDCTFPPGMAGAGEFYERQLPRRAWIVFEYDGDSFRRRLEGLRRRIEQMSADLESRKATTEELEGARTSLQGALRSASRLVPIDAGTDVSALEARYTDRGRYMILRASVRASADVPFNPDRKTSSAGGPRSPELSGRIEQVLIDRISVPPRWRATLAALGQAPVAGSGPRYAVTLHSGRRHEPWIVVIRRLDPAPAGARAPSTPPGAIR
jgi:hypothetical protein